MSTRCIVRVKQGSVCSKKNYKLDLYHHHDGYIEGVGFDLFRRFLNKDTNRLELHDVMYTVDKLVKDNNDEYKCTPYKHADIEYFYEIDIDCDTITAWEVNNWGDRMQKYKKYSHDEILEMYLKEV